MRARLLSWLLLAMLLAPPLAYEALEKSSEHLGRPPHHLLRISARAERETPWRARTGEPLVDRTLHELQEARHFYRLVGDRLRRDLR